MSKPYCAEFEVQSTYQIDRLVTGFNIYDYYTLTISIASWKTKLGYIETSLKGYIEWDMPKDFEKKRIQRKVYES